MTSKFVLLRDPIGADFCEGCTGVTCWCLTWAPLEEVPLYSKTACSVFHRKRSRFYKARQIGKVRKGGTQR